MSELLHDVAGLAHVVGAAAAAFPAAHAAAHPAAPTATAAAGIAAITSCGRFRRRLCREVFIEDPDAVQSGGSRLCGRDGRGRCCGYRRLLRLERKEAETKKKPGHRDYDRAMVLIIPGILSDRFERAVR